jgi:hypothetical protein
LIRGPITFKPPRCLNHLASIEQQNLRKTKVVVSMASLLYQNRTNNLSQIFLPTPSNLQNIVIGDSDEIPSLLPWIVAGASSIQTKRGDGEESDACGRVGILKAAVARGTIRPQGQGDLIIDLTS